MKLGCVTISKYISFDNRYKINKKITHYLKMKCLGLGSNFYKLISVIAKVNLNILKLKYITLFLAGFNSI